MWAQMVETLQISSGTQLVDLKTGKLTREGIYILQLVSEVQSNLVEHETAAATTSVVGHVKKGAAVADGAASTVSVDSADVSAGPASYNQTWGVEVETLANEAKSDINTLVTDVNAIKTQFNALLSSLRAAGVLTS